MIYGFSDSLRGSIPSWKTYQVCHGSPIFHSKETDNKWERAYLHIYYDKERTAKEHDRSVHRIIRIENRLADGTVKMDSADTEK